MTALTEALDATLLTRDCRLAVAATDYVRVNLLWRAVAGHEIVQRAAGDRLQGSLAFRRFDRWWHDDLVSWRIGAVSEGPVCGADQAGLVHGQG